MMFRSIAIWILLVMLSCWGIATSARAVSNNSTPAASNHKIVVYYLYFTPRCETCLNMEAFAKEAVAKGFAHELKQGLVEWHAYDTGKDEFKHYWDEYKLETKSLIIADIRDGKQVRWKNCEQIWDLVAAKPDFITYVQKEVRAYLAPDSLQTPASKGN
jgi:hypothetical protein